VAGAAASDGVGSSGCVGRVRVPLAPRLDVDQRVGHVDIAHQVVRGDAVLEQPVHQHGQQVGQVITGFAVVFALGLTDVDAEVAVFPSGVKADQVFGVQEPLLLEFADQAVEAVPTACIGLSPCDLAVVGRQQREAHRFQGAASVPQESLGVGPLGPGTGRHQLGQARGVGVERALDIGRQGVAVGVGHWMGSVTLAVRWRCAGGKVALGHDHTGLGG